MKNVKFSVGTALCLGLLFAVASDSFAQAKPKASPQATVSQVIGAKNEIKVVYHRPSVKGRDVWKDSSPNAQIGKLVPRDGEPRPWRAGANNATTIEFTEDVKVGGKDVSAGTYALFMIPRDGDWTVIINSAAKSWGSFTYKEENDVARVDAAPQAVPHQEQLVYGFEDLEAYGCTLYLHWEKVKIGVKIETKSQ